MIAVFKKEFKGFFNTIIGYIVLAIFYIFVSFTFVNGIYYYGSPQVELLVASPIIQIISMVLIPILTMRLMSEDRRQKTDQALLTAPVKPIGIVLGKFFAAFSVYVMCFLPTIIFELIVADHLPGLNFFPYFYSLLGMLLMGGALTAIGMFVSSLTESQVVAAIIGIVINIFMFTAPSLAELTNVEFIMTVAEKISFSTYITTFSTQIISFTDILYFVSVAVIFLFLCVRSLQKRRWS